MQRLHGSPSAAAGGVEVARTPCLVIKVAAALGLAADGGVVQGEVGGLGAHGNAVPAADTTDLPPTDGWAAAA